MSMSSLKQKSPLSENSPTKMHLMDSSDLNENTKSEIITAINKSMAVIEFQLDGTIIHANDLFLSTLGYTLNEVVGQHHRIFCEKEYANSTDYKNFWAQLNRGEFDSGEYKRIGKNGNQVWISASYNPILDSNGRPYKVIKFASDISAQKLKDAELDALSKTQAVIDFHLDGTIIDANSNFLSRMGYNLNEITGKHHRMFCDPQYVKSPEYQNFWKNLASGEFLTGEFKRIDKSGNEVWLNASYNPVYDLGGKVYKIVKYATDITKQKQDSIELIKTLADTAAQVGSLSEELTATSANFADTAEKTRTQSSSVAVASEEVAKGMQTVAVNTEEMVASIKEISNNTAKGSDKSSQSLQKAQDANILMTKLGDQSEQIGSVVKTINAIAQQTNLLALNATIEAARAGEAGKGFAVVANEVKELAKETAKATDDITKKISDIQQNTGNAVHAIADITSTIEDLNSISSSIASAVEEQSATTDEVSRIVNDSNTAVNGISENIRNVSDGARESAHGASELQKASSELSALASNLTELVQRLEE